MLHLIFYLLKGATYMQDNNLQTYVKMYCEKQALSCIKIKRNESIRETFNRAKIEWSYEIVSDIPIFEDTRAITVRLYIPGGIYTGRYVYNKEQAKEAHYLALEDAFKQNLAIVYIDDEKTQEMEQTKPEQIPVIVETPTESAPQSNAPLSQEEILNMIIEQQNISTSQPDTSITTAEQLNNDPRQEIPFEEIQLPESELDKMLSGNIQSSVPVQQAPIPTQFTQDQIQRMNAFKQKFGVKTDEDFSKYVNAWDKKYNNKRDITPANIESFLKYVEDLGKFPG
jgi:hypothetical protein